MINLSDFGQVYLVCGKTDLQTDLRKGIDGLATAGPILEESSMKPCHKRLLPNHLPSKGLTIAIECFVWKKLGNL